MAEAVPQHKVQHVALAWSEVAHGGVHLGHEDLEVLRRPCRGLGQALNEPQPPEARPEVVGHHAPGDTKQPQAVLGRARYGVEAAPGDREYLGDDVADVVVADATADVTGDRMTMGGIEGLEPALAFHRQIHPGHLVGLRSLSFTQLHGRHNSETVNTLR
jgi:hypothetical protein